MTKEADKMYDMKKTATGNQPGSVDLPESVRAYDPNYSKGKAGAGKDDSADGKSSEASGEDTKKVPAEL